MRIHRRLLPLPLLLLLPLLPVLSSAAEFPKLSTRNVELTASAGYLATSMTGESERGRAFDAAGGVMLSLHPSLALAGNFDHGFPAAGGQHVNIARLSGQLRIYPTLGEAGGADHLFAQAGPMWIGERSLREWAGLNTQLTYSHSFSPVLFAYAAYSHGFAWREEDGDRDFLRAGLGVGTALGR